MDKIKTGKFLSLILRHSPQTIGITLDENGWANASELLEGMNKKGYAINMEILQDIVDTNNKKRYSFNDDKTKIRANQGHSVDVDVELKELEPPEELYHGTATRFLDSIKEHGLQKQNRNHVHLSKDKETAAAVGKRHGNPIVLTIKSGEMYRDGYRFYFSENGVWLTDEISVKYIVF